MSRPPPAHPSRTAGQRGLPGIRPPPGLEAPEQRGRGGRGRAAPESGHGGDVLGVRVTAVPGARERCWTWAAAPSPPASRGPDSAPVPRMVPLLGPILSAAVRPWAPSPLPHSSQPVTHRGHVQLGGRGRLVPSRGPGGRCGWAGLFFQ